MTNFICSGLTTDFYFWDGPQTCYTYSTFICSTYILSLSLSFYISITLIKSFLLFRLNFSPAIFSFSSPSTCILIYILASFILHKNIWSKRLMSTPHIAFTLYTPLNFSSLSIIKSIIFFHINQFIFIQFLLLFLSNHIKSIIIKSFTLYTLASPCIRVNVLVMGESVRNAQISHTISYFITFFPILVILYNQPIFIPNNTYHM